MVVVDIDKEPVEYRPLHVEPKLKIGRELGEQAWNAGELNGLVTGTKSGPVAAKLGATGRVEAARTAREKGWL